MGVGPLLDQDDARQDQGRNPHRFLEERLHVDARAPVEMQARLRRALRNHEFRLHYQPQLSLSERRIIGMEALIRWRDEQGGNIAPAAFIPVAEMSGLVIPIGQWVLEEACRQAVAWRRAGLPALLVCVNLSAVQFARGDLVETVAATLAKTGLEASHLDLEVTESVLMQDIRETSRQLKELKALGVSVSLDDFGTGYSSLSYLEELPIDNLKIDRRFVQRMNGADNTRTLVESIVGLAHGLGMRAVAEGVETRVQLQHLKAMGCDRAQSFMLGGPAPALSIQALLAARADDRQRIAC